MVRDKEIFPKKLSYISSFVRDEESKRLSLKTLSDGGSFDDDDDDDDEDLEKVTELNKIQSELQEVVDKIDESIRETNHDTAIKEESETTIEFELPKSERSHLLKKPDSVGADDGTRGHMAPGHCGTGDMLGAFSLGKLIIITHTRLTLTLDTT